VVQMLDAANDGIAFGRGILEIEFDVVQVLEGSVDLDT